jgi:hypothetical protein
MMKPAAALSLTRNDQVKFGKETLTVIGSIDVGTHEEPLLISESGKKYFGTLFIAHLLTRLGGPEQKLDEDEDEGEPTSSEMAYENLGDIPRDQSLVGNNERVEVSAQPAEVAPVAAIEAPSSDLSFADDESNIPEDELELVKAYTLNELL